MTVTADRARHRLQAFRHLRQRPQRQLHLGRLDRLGVAYCKAFCDPFIELHKDTEYSKVATISVDAPGAEIRYTLDGSTPTAESRLYEGPFVINRQQRVTAAAFREGKRIGDIKYKIF